MKTAIIYKSIHHGNTKIIAEVISEALEADSFNLKDVDKDIIQDYDLIGFGSGIYFNKPHKKLVKFIDNLNNVKSKKAFVFTTSGRGKSEYNDILKNKLLKKDFKILGDFSCKGFDTWGPFKLIGGMNKGKPDKKDLKNAGNFANDLKKKL